MFAFLEEVAGVGGKIVEAVDLARGPAHLDLVDAGCRAEAKVEAWVAG